jgi:uncharacterized protein (DUF2267 family)
MEERRSAAQICEAFLKTSAENYRKEGTKIVPRYLPQRIRERWTVFPAKVPPQLEIGNRYKRI